MAKVSKATVHALSLSLLEERMGTNEVNSSSDPDLNFVLSQLVVHEVFAFFVTTSPPAILPVF